MKGTSWQSQPTVMSLEECCLKQKLVSFYDNRLRICSIIIPLQTRPNILSSWETLTPIKILNKASMFLSSVYFKQILNFCVMKELKDVQAKGWSCKKSQKPSSRKKLISQLGIAQAGIKKLKSSYCFVQGGSFSTLCFQILSPHAVISCTDLPKNLKS